MKKNLLLIILFLVTQPAFSKDQTVEQKMIIVKGDRSFLMQGDPYQHQPNKPHSYRKNRVLPALLKQGWMIKEIKVNERSSEENLYGYVLLEKSR